MPSGPMELKTKAENLVKFPKQAEKLKKVESLLFQLRTVIEKKTRA